MTCTRRDTVGEKWPSDYVGFYAGKPMEMLFIMFMGLCCFENFMLFCDLWYSGSDSGFTVFYGIPFFFSFTLDFVMLIIIVILMLEGKRVVLENRFDFLKMNIC